MRLMETQLLSSENWSCWSRYLPRAKVQRVRSGRNLWKVLLLPGCILYIINIYVVVEIYIYLYFAFVFLMFLCTLYIIYYTSTLSPTTWSVETILCQGPIFHFMICEGNIHIPIFAYTIDNLLCTEITVERSPGLKRQLIPVLTTGFIHPRQWLLEVWIISSIVNTM